ncbi:MAG: DedA family protein, partial [Planctomycetota bacterium]
LIGFAFWTMLGHFFMTYVPGCTQENIDYVGTLYRDNAFWTIFAAGFTPIPYKVFTIAAGIFHEYVPLTVLVVASLFGRFARFYLVGAFIYVFGPGVKRLIEKYFDLAALAFLILLVGGFLVVKFAL